MFRLASTPPCPRGPEEKRQQRERARREIAARMRAIPVVGGARLEHGLHGRGARADNLRCAGAGANHLLRDVPPEGIAAYA